MFKQIMGSRAGAGNVENNPGNTVKNPDFRILEVICGLAGKFNKTYAFPTQEKILELVCKFTGRTMSRRTLNRHLRALEQGHWLQRTQRHRRDKKLGFVLRSTLYRPLWRYCQRLQRNARAIFSILGAMTGKNPPIHVSLMAQNLNIFFKKFIQTG